MRRLLFATLCCTLAAATAFAQQDDEAPPPAPTSKAFAAKLKLPVPPKNAPLVPLDPHDRALQLLDRFTFGARPGELERVLSASSEKWFEQQLSPDSIPDSQKDQRMGDFPTLSMTPEQALYTFPDYGAVEQVYNGKVPYPTDPLLAALYQVQVYKFGQRTENQKLTKAGTPPPEPSDAEKAAQKKLDQAAATHLAGELLILPKRDRMAALIKLPVTDRITLTSFVSGDQKNQLQADFNPHEREIFTSMGSNAGASYQIPNELAQARMVRDILTERQVQEVMTDFWFNHFNVYAGKDSDQWYTTAYERDVIRKHALGKFRDLLIATATSPAMMVYLDNWLSIGPDSIANGVNPANLAAKKGTKGLNENYGREVMELHTVGVNGGYSQADVTALAAILTGWTVDRPNQGGPFLYDPKKHEPGPKQWFGYEIAADGTATRLPNSGKDSANVAVIPSVKNLDVDPGMKQGIEALSILAASPQTAHFISFKLAQRFVADDPPPALVDRMGKVYLASDGDIKAVLRVLVASPEFNSKKYFRNKVKTPVEFIASAFRSTGTDPANPGALTNTIKAMGMQLYYALPPTGYYITADQWMNTGALVDRLNFAYQLTTGKFYNLKFDSPRLLALGLMTNTGAISAAAPAAIASATAAARDTRPRFSPAKMNGATTEAPAASDAPASSGASTPGAEVALHVLENTMIGGQASAQTNQLIHKQLDQQPASASPTDTLNLLTALVMGSPEFQLR